MKHQFAIIFISKNHDNRILRIYCLGNYYSLFFSIGLYCCTDRISWANKKGIITGYTDTGLFGPGDDITREQLVVMMYRYQKSISDVKAESVDLSDFKDGAKVSAFAKEAMEWAVGTGVISGKDNGTVLDPQGTATRAECATIIIRMLDNME